MKAVDIIFGRRLDNSRYHVQLMYIDRADAHSDDDMLDAVIASIPKIPQRISSLPDDVTILLGRIETDLKTLKENLPNDSNEIIKDVNLAFAELEYNGYELLAIGRGDVDKSVAFDTEVDHAYMMIKCLFNKQLFGINNFQLGVHTVFDNLYDSNTTAMVMEFFVNGKFKLGDENDEAMLGLNEIINTYRSLSDRHQTAYMDSTKFINFMESLGYRYVIILQ